jgi:epoxyqueuosine reductase
MKTDEAVKKLQRALRTAGFRSALVSAHHLPDLESDLEDLLAQGILSRDFYDEVTSRYDLHFSFAPPAHLSTAKTIIITATPQPKISVNFRSSGKAYSVIIPPTYLHDTNERVSEIVSLHSGECGYKACDAVLPAKLLAVRSGLASYGKNNVAYIDDWGSYFRLRAFFTDMPPTVDNWQEVKMMDLCDKCETCVKKCPTGAIRPDRFLISAEKCLTFFNEGEEDFPEWIDPAWHNCIIGCMICQDVCPANKARRKWIVSGEDFSPEETLTILKGTPKDRLPPGVTEKLQRLYMLDWYDSLPRNLGVLINKR